MSSSTTRAHMKRNFTLQAGDDKILRFTIKDEAGVVVNIAGFTVEWKMFDRNGVEILSKSTGAGSITLSDPANGVCDVTVDSADTTALEGVFKHELDGIDGSSNRATLAGGVVRIPKRRT